MKLESSSLNKQPNDSGLQHLFNQKMLTPDQTHGLLKFREIGQEDYETWVEYYVIRMPSVKPPKHRKCLLTFTDKISRRKKMSAVEKERKFQIECWKKRVAFTTFTGAAQMQDMYKQIIELPRALATTDGKPTRGTKCSTTNCLEKRYQNARPKF